MSCDSIFRDFSCSHGYFGLARHGAGLTSHGNCEGHTSPSANVSTDILRIAIGLVRLFRRTISSITCRLAPQRHPLHPSLSNPSRGPHPHLPPLPGRNHTENPRRS